MAMNPHNNGFRPPFFYNGSCPPPNPGVVPTTFNRPPPPFPPPANMRFPPPGYNSFPTGPNNNHQMRPYGFQRPNFNYNNNQNPFSSPPPPVHGPPPPRPPRPSFTPDTVFSPPPNNTTVATSQEGFPFNGNQHQSPQPAPFAGGARGGGRGRGDWRGRGRGGFPNNRPNQGQKKKEKLDKRDLAENNAFYCDTCDRGFKNQEKYQEHVNGHMKCSYKDCPFIAAPKLVHLHIALQHRTGLAKKVWSLESEEDVKKWREERKRKFPTAANIAKKKEEEAERIARGEVLQTKDFSGRQRGRERGRGGRGQGRGQNRRGRGRGGRFHPGSGDSFTEEIKKPSEGEDSSGSDDDSPPTEVAIKHSKPLEEAKEEDNKEKVEESVEITEGQQEKSVLENGPRNTSSLGLLASYDYSSSEEEEGKDVGGGESEKLPQSDECVSSLVTVPEEEEEFQPSPSKRPRLLPNPFLSQTSSPQSEGKHTEASSSAPIDEQLSCIALSTNNTSNSQSELSPTKAEGLGNQDCLSRQQNSSESNNLKQTENLSPSKLQKPVNGGEVIVSKAENRSPEKENICENQGPLHEVEAKDLEPQAKSAKDSVSPQVNNATEDVEMKDSSQSGNGSKRSRKPNRGRQQANRQRPGRQAAIPHTYTLLEKILAPDIRRERNKILQCVHYIVKNKFFDSLPKTTGSSSSAL